MSVLGELSGAPWWAILWLTLAAAGMGVVWVGLRPDPAPTPQSGGELGDPCPVCSEPDTVTGRVVARSRRVSWRGCWLCGRYLEGQPLGAVAYQQSLADVSRQRLELFERLERLGIDFDRGPPWSEDHVPTTEGLRKLAERLEQEDTHGPLR